MMRMQTRIGLSSHIVVMTFGGNRKEEIPTEFLQIKRGLDVYWRTVIGGNPAVIVLMPFASASGKEGFVQRIDGWVRARFHESPEALRISMRAIDFSHENPVDVLEELLAAGAEAG